MKGNTLLFGTLSNNDNFYENLYIQLKPEDSNFVKAYKNIVIKYGDEEINIPTEKLFKKIKELFRENEDD